jgi:hypothetical protein
MAQAVSAFIRPDVAVGSKAEDLNMSKCFPFFPQERTSMKSMTDHSEAAERGLSG